MNPNCKCDGPGWCDRHKMDKNDIQFKLCKGIPIAGNTCTNLHWNCWERGECGATAPTGPVLMPGPLCESSTPSGQQAPCSTCSGSGVASRPSYPKYVSNFAMAAMRFVKDGFATTSEPERAVRESICNACPLKKGVQCSACGCVLNLKQRARLEQCPASKWLPNLREPRPLVNARRNLIFHLLPVEFNQNWKWNLQQLAMRWPLFNGRMCIAIAIQNDGRLKTVSADDVIEYCGTLGMEWDAVDARYNDHNLREVMTFPWLLKQVESTDPNEITFSCHGKAVTHDEQSITKRWAETQYHVCLDDWNTIQNALERYSMAGSIRRFGEFQTPGNHRWHYSGTFYWFRHDDVFSTNRWQKIDQEFFGTESWPGLMFPPEQTACLFGDNAEDPYKQDSWKKLQTELETWEAARQ